MDSCRIPATKRFRDPRGLELQFGRGAPGIFLLRPQSFSAPPVQALRSSRAFGRGTVGVLGRRMVAAVRAMKPIAEHLLQVTQGALQIRTDGLLIWSHISLYAAGPESGSPGYPSRQAAVDLQRLQIRSPGQELSKRSRHIRQRRTMDSSASWISGFLNACFVMTSMWVSF